VTVVHNQGASGLGPPENFGGPGVNPSALKGHETYDNDFTSPMFGKAKTAAADLIFAVLSNLDNDKDAYYRDAGVVWNKYFQQAILENPYSDQVSSSPR
jgi:hypothetical protein